MTYAKIHATKLYRMGQINGENQKFEAGETKVLPLTDRVESLVDNANALELIDTADTFEELTDSNDSQGETEEKEVDKKGDEGDADNSDGEQSYGERLRSVEGVGDSRAEQIEEFAADEDEMVEYLNDGETDALPDKVVENLKAEFL